MGKRYVIELEDEYLNKNGAKNGPELLYRVKGFNTLVFDEKGLERLEKASEKVETEATLENVERAIKAAYLAGKKDGKAEALKELINSDKA